MPSFEGVNQGASTAAIVIWSLAQSGGLILSEKTVKKLTWSVSEKARFGYPRVTFWSIFGQASKAVSPISWKPSTFLTQMRDVLFSLTGNANRSTVKRLVFITTLRT